MAVWYFENMGFSRRDAKKLEKVAKAFMDVCSGYSRWSIINNICSAITADLRHPFKLSIKASEEGGWFKSVSVSRTPEPVAPHRQAPLRDDGEGGEKATDGEGKEATDVKEYKNLYFFASDGGSGDELNPETLDILRKHGYKVGLFAKRHNQWKEEK